MVRNVVYVPLVPEDSEPVYRIALAVAAAAIGSLIVATPASADTTCKTVHEGAFPTVEMCLPIPNPFQ